MDEKTEQQAEFFANRLEKRYKHLKKWAKRTGVTCYRLYDKDIPEVPLAIDLYEDKVLVFLYERPYEKDEKEEEIWLACMKIVVSKVLNIPEDSVYTKVRKRQFGEDQYEKNISQKNEFLVQEGGLKFRINITDYLDTGLFLDHRNSREHARSLAKGKKCLNLFCYTGSFSLYMLSGGADSVVSVDLSNTYLAWAEVNMGLNDFQTSGKNRLIKADAREFLKEENRAKREYDLIVCDPPTFSNSKMMMSDFDVNKDWEDLIQDCVDLLSPNGKLLFSTNSRRFKLDPEKIVNASVIDISKQSIPEDYRDQKIHKCFEFTKL